MSVIDVYRKINESDRKTWDDTDIELNDVVNCVACKIYTNKDSNKFSEYNLYFATGNINEIRKQIIKESINLPNTDLYVSVSKKGKNCVIFDLKSVKMLPYKIYMKELLGDKTAVVEDVSKSTVFLTQMCKKTGFVRYAIYWATE